MRGLQLCLCLKREEEPSPIRRACARRRKPASPTSQRGARSAAHSPAPCCSLGGRLHAMPKANYFFKCVVIGDIGVGKSNLLSSAMQSSFSKDSGRVTC